MYTLLKLSELGVMQEYAQFVSLEKAKLEYEKAPYTSVIKRADGKVMNALGEWVYLHH